MHQSGMNHVFDGLDERGWEGFIEILGNMMQVGASAPAIHLDSACQIPGCSF